MKIGDNCWIFIRKDKQKPQKKLAIGFILMRDGNNFRVKVKRKIYTRKISEIARIREEDKELLKNY